MKMHYCNYDCCTEYGACEFCQSEITVDRTYANTIDVILPCGYRQKFWVDLTDQQAIERAQQMKDKGISPY